MWVGPAEFHPYSPLWVPQNWRAWTPFGTGCIGDWGCHLFDPSFWALDLGAPTSVRAEVDSSYDPKKHALIYPCGTKVTYRFPAKGKRGSVKLIWFDGTMRAPRSEDLNIEAPHIGAVVYGEGGAIVHGSHGAHGLRILPDEKANDYKKPPQSIPRVKGHFEDWLEAIRTGRQAGSDFSYGGPLTEIGLLGAIAIRFPGQELRWDAEAMKFTNFSAANAYVAPACRPGWTISTL